MKHVTETQPTSPTRPLTLEEQIEEAFERLCVQPDGPSACVGVHDQRTYVYLPTSRQSQDEDDRGMRFFG